MTKPKPKILLLGGTGEGVAINNRLFDQGFPLITSLAGVTKNPTALQGKILANGFQEVGGLSALLKEEGIKVVVDATHPFAVQMSDKAAEICGSLGIPYLRYHRQPWEEVTGDRWITVSDVTEAAQVAAEYKRVFLTIGRKEVVTFEAVPADFFLLRSVEEVPFNPLSAEVVHLRDRGPFEEMAEAELLSRYQIGVIVSKNSGGRATYGKIAAARDLGIPVIMIAPPVYSSQRPFTDFEALFSYLNSLS